MIYAIETSQSARLMYGYKSAAPGPNHQLLVTILLAVANHLHQRCAAVLAGHPITQWATIPSLKPDKLGTDHPLRQILTSYVLSALPEILIEANPPIVNPRGLESANFRIATPVPPGTHVLVIDDTWTSGGHAQSDAAALKGAGAQQVSVLTVARWLRPGDTLTAEYIRTHLATQVYNPAQCPWTAGPCP